MNKHRIKKIEERLRVKNKARIFVVIEEKGKFHESKDNKIYSSLEALKKARGIEEHDTLIHVSEYL